MTTKSTPDFPRWIPSAARDRILELRQVVSTPEELAVLDRLAIYEEMHTGVWQRLQKLGPRAAGMEGQIIEWTIIGVELAWAQRPPFPKSTAKVHKYIAKYPPMATAQDAAVRARFLVDAMDQNRQNAEGVWEAYLQTTWRGQTLSYQEARDFVERLTHFFEVLGVESQAVVDALKLPRIRKKQAANARELILSQFLSDRFFDHFNNRCDPIVGALVGVALGSENGPDAVKIRGRRRRQRKISSKKRR